VPRSRLSKSTELINLTCGIRSARLNVTQVINQQPIGRLHAGSVRRGQARGKSNRHHISTIAVVTDRQTVRRPVVSRDTLLEWCEPYRDQFWRGWIRRIYCVVEMLNGTAAVVR